MSRETTRHPSSPAAATRVLETVAAWLLGLLWVLPLAYAVWTAFHPAAYATRFEIGAPLTWQNFVNAWHAAPFARYFVNTTVLVAMVLVAQLVLVHARRLRVGALRDSAAATSCSGWCCCS